MSTIEKQYDKYKELLTKLNYEGMDEFLSWLDDTDFIVMPASTRYHEAYDGGLVEHSINTFRIAKKIAKDYSDLLTKKDVRSLLLCALVHDICKHDSYEPYQANVKDETTGKWSKARKWKWHESDTPLGHGEKSVFLVQKHIDLSVAEACAIRHHMGHSEDVGQMKKNDVTQSFSLYPISFLLHMADSMSVMHWCNYAK